MNRSHSFLIIYIPLFLTIPCWLSRHLTKRAQGRSFFGFKNYKKRFFVLTNKGLSYYKTKGKGLLCNIPCDDIKGVEKLGEESFKYKLVRSQFCTQFALCCCWWYLCYCSCSLLLHFLLLLFS